MKPYVLIILVVAFAPLPLRAQNPAEPPKVVKITLHPMAAPGPALKYRLLPSVLDTRPGNAAVLWNRIPSERTAYFHDLDKLWETTDEWMEIPLDDSREKEFRAKHHEIADAVPSGSMFADMARAARFESCDWQLPIHEGNVYQILLPELQQLRTYGRLLAAKARLEIADGKCDQAVETMQTGFALARDAAKGFTLIHALVGAAIAGQSTRQIEQFVQRPDAPNLYWALSTLPRPLVDFRPGFEGETNSLFLQFPELRDLDKKDLSAEEWRKLLGKLFNALNDISGGRKPSPELGVETAAIALQGYPMAKQYLIEHGRPAADVEAMPVAKAILIYSVEVYQELADESFKSMFLPYAEGRKWLLQGDQFVKAAGHREIFPFASLTVPAVKAVKVAETRVEWIFARLRILEALRLYAAAHDGKLPDSLGDITEAPIPRNPFDDKPFDYHRDGNRAVLDCQDGPPGLPWRYEITMLPKGEKP
jgi:hypothetical protein